MSYNKTYSEIKQILKDSKRISKATMLKIAKLAILETLGEERSADVEVKWDSKLGAITLNYRHVNKFKWNDGIWSGFIGPYDILDIHYNYKIFENLSLSISAQNIFNDKHKELIGGAKIGRQINFRLESTF